MVVDVSSGLTVLYLPLIQMTSYLSIDFLPEDSFFWIYPHAIRPRPRSGHR